MKILLGVIVLILLLMILLGTIGHFRVYFSLYFKASLYVRSLSHEYQFSFMFKLANYNNKNFILNLLWKRVRKEFRNGLFHFIIKGVLPEHHPIIIISEKLIRPNILLIFPVRFRETSKCSVLFCGMMRIWKPHLYFAVRVVFINIIWVSSSFQNMFFTGERSLEIVRSLWSWFK